MPTADLAGRQLKLIARLSALEPTISFMGGHAEDDWTLALYQVRAGIARRNSFGPLSDRQLAKLAELRESSSRTPRRTTSCRPPSRCAEPA
jgi:hypothetical protein